MPGPYGDWKKNQPLPYGNGGEPPLPFFPKDFSYLVGENGRLPIPVQSPGDGCMTEEDFDLLRQAWDEFVSDGTLMKSGIKNYGYSASGGGMPNEETYWNDLAQTTNKHQTDDLEISWYDLNPLPLPEQEQEITLAQMYPDGFPTSYQTKDRHNSDKTDQTGGVGMQSTNASNAEEPAVSVLSEKAPLKAKHKQAPAFMTVDEAMEYLNKLKPNDKAILHDLLKKWHDGTITQSEEDTLRRMMPSIDQEQIKPKYTINALPDNYIMEHEMTSAILDYGALMRAAYFHPLTSNEKERLAFLERALSPKDKQTAAALCGGGVAVFSVDPDTLEVEMKNMDGVRKASLGLISFTSQREDNRDWELDQLEMEYRRLQKKLASGTGSGSTGNHAGTDEAGIPQSLDELKQWYEEQKQAIKDHYSLEAQALPTQKMLDAFMKQWESWTPEQRNEYTLITNAGISFGEFNLSMGKAIFGADYLEGEYQKFLRGYYMLMYARSGGKSMEPTLMDKIIQGVAGAIPNAVLALMSMGTSAPLPTTESLMAYGPDMFNTYNTIKRGLQAVTQDPKFTPNFVVESSSSFQDAKGKGADPLEAAAYAWLEGFFGAASDINGVFSVDDSVKKGVGKFVGELISNGGNDAVSGLTSKLNAMLTYDQDKDIFSFTDSDALINPQDIASDYLGGMVTGAAEYGWNAGLDTAAADLSEWVQAAYDDGLVSEQTAKEFLNILNKAIQRE